MTEQKRLRIAIVSAFYSQGMGYSENCLSRALARLGHEVHVITSTYNVYGNIPLYDETYRGFLGPRQMPTGTFTVDGYTVHRLETSLVAGYVWMHGLAARIVELQPDIVHSIEVASLQTFALAALKPTQRFKLFTETHQNVSVLKPYMRDPNGPLLKRAGYRLTRTLPSYLSSLVMEKCYAVAADCVQVATDFYGVPEEKVALLLLGTDTEIFRPAETPEEIADRRAIRAGLGYGEDDVVCLYTGRFSGAKNPLVLARAVEKLSARDARFHALFVGEGEQRDAIASCRNARILPFMTHDSLSRHYRAADVAVWPRQESMSMLDAAASGLPLVVSDTIGDPERVRGNGSMYREDDVDSMAEVLNSLGDTERRRSLGDAGRKKMVGGFSWTRFARTVEADFLHALGQRSSAG